MEKLTYLEQKFIFLLAKTTPYPEDEVEMVYRRCKSFDLTKRILEEGEAHAVDLNSIIADPSNRDVGRPLDDKTKKSLRIGIRDDGKELYMTELGDKYNPFLEIEKKDDGSVIFIAADGFNERAEVKLIKEQLQFLLGWLSDA